MAQQNKNSNQPQGFGGFDDLISEFSEDLVMPPQAKPVSPATSTASRSEPTKTPPVAPPRSNNPSKPVSAAKPNTAQDTQLIHLDDWIEMTAAESAKPPTQSQPSKPEVRVIVEPKPASDSLTQATEQGIEKALWFSVVCGIIIFIYLFSSSNKNQASSKTWSSMATQSNPVVIPSTTTTGSAPTYSNSAVHNSSPIAPSKLSAPTEITKPSNYQEAIKKWVTDGKSYYWGKNNVKNYQQAFQYFKVAAEEGNAEAQVWLGILYSEGKGVSKNDAESIQWYRKAADQGNAVAMFNLGLRYSEGRGVTQDKQLAIYWFKKSAELGYKDSKKALGKINKSTQKMSKSNKDQPNDNRQNKRSNNDQLNSNRQNQKPNMKNPDLQSNKNLDTNKIDQEKCKKIKEEINLYSSRMHQKNIDDIVGYDQANKKYQQNCGKF